MSLKDILNDTVLCEADARISSNEGNWYILKVVLEPDYFNITQRPEFSCPSPMLERIKPDVSAQYRINAEINLSLVKLDIKEALDRHGYHHEHIDSIMQYPENMWPTATYEFRIIPLQYKVRTTKCQQNTKNTDS